MTARYHVAPDGYGDETIWRGDYEGDDAPSPVLARPCLQGPHRDDLWALIVAAATK